jgi:hypothetical protein
VEFKVETTKLGQAAFLVDEERRVRIELTEPACRSQVRTKFEVDLEVRRASGQPTEVKGRPFAGRLFFVPSARCAQPLARE